MTIHSILLGSSDISKAMAKLSKPQKSVSKSSDEAQPVGKAGKAAVRSLSSSSLSKNKAARPLKTQSSTGVSKKPASRKPTKPKSGARSSPPKSTSGLSSPPSQLSPKSPDIGLCKRRGRCVNSGRAINPEVVDVRRALKLFPEMKREASSGLWNKATFCYRNATVQGLIHVPAVIRYLAIVHQDCPCQPRDCVVCALQLLTQRYWNDDESPEKARAAFLRASGLTLNVACQANPPDSITFANMSDEFEGETQSDAMEFLQYLLSHIQATALASDVIPFSAMFHIAQEQRWTCSDCNEDHLLHIPASDLGTCGGLNVDIQQPRKNGTLMEYLREQFQAKLRVYCDSPQCSPKHTKQTRVTNGGPERSVDTWLVTTPEVLIIRLKRFKHRTKKDAKGVEKAHLNKDNQLVPIKLRDKVFFDEYLNLAEFAKNPPEDEELLYRLDAVVAHNGGPSAGHYIAAVREKNGRDFVSISDDKLIRSSKRGGGTFLELQMPALGEMQFEPYILLYSKL